MTSNNEDSSKVASVKYYVLNDSNAREFYDEWRFKTMALIRKKGWSAPFNDVSEATGDEAAQEPSAEEQRELEKANEEAYDQLLMGCRVQWYSPRTGATSQWKCATGT